MKVAILQSNYIPWRGYFDLIHDCDRFVFYDEVQFTKNDWRNRNQIYTKNGLQWLTIAVPELSPRLRISEVTFAKSDWQQQHLKTLQMAYARAPHFEQLQPALHEFYETRTWNTLSQFNQHSVKWLARYVGIEHTEFLDSAQFDLPKGRVERLLFLLKELKATEYVSGPAAREYLSPSIPLFQQAGIEVTFKTYPAYKPYAQFDLPFEPQVSVLDLIAHVPRDEFADHIWKVRQLPRA